MVFSSIFFIFCFLPIFLIIYYMACGTVRKVVLLGASLTFYFMGENFLIWILLASTCIDYFCGLLISNGFSRKTSILELSENERRSAKQKIGLAISMSSNLLFLAYFKYSNFIVDNSNALIHFVGGGDGSAIIIEKVALPLGISFYTFQSMSYTIDVYWGKVKATRNFIDFACYVTMFPQLVAGPIVRYRDLYKQLRCVQLRQSLVARGINRFTLGLAKKVLIANTVSILADGVFNHIPQDQLSFCTAWLGAVAYSLQIYFDFSGYSDMAIGLGMMLGFRFLENFNYPYIARSIKGFWRRWHISLSTWFRDYLYIPLGGSRQGEWRKYRNLVTVFLLCGLWHGAEWTFVVWGAYHGFFLVLEQGKLFQRIHSRLLPAAQHCYTIFVVIIGWVIFRAESITYAGNYLNAMFGGNGFHTPFYSFQEFLGMDVFVAMLFGVVFATPIFPYLTARYSMLKDSLRFPMIASLCENIFLMLLFLLCIIPLSSGVHNPFLYFRF